MEDQWIDRFIGKPGELKEVTDPEEIARIHRITGFVPYSEEKQQWMREEGERRIAMHIAVSSQGLSDEYDRLKAQGKL